MHARIAARTLTEERYAETFAVFLQHSREYSHIVKDLEYIIKNKNVLSLLDVGAGSGTPIKALLTRSRVEIDEYVAIEPNQHHAESLRKAFSNQAVRSIEILSDPFTVALNIKRSFDMALFCHSLYGMNSPANCLLHALKFIEPNGIVIAYIQGPHGPYSLYRFFNPIFERDIPSPEDLLSSLELINALQELSISPVIRTLPTSIELTRLFAPEYQDELAEFVSFCLLVEFKRLPSQLQMGIIEYIRSNCVATNGGLFWHAPTIAVTLTPNDLTIL